MIRIGLIYLLLCFANTLFAQQQELSTHLIRTDNLENFYQVNAQLFRSAQITKKSTISLSGSGINSVINLRRWFNDNRELKNSQITAYHLPILTTKMDQEDVLNALKMISKAEKPVLIHCLHGSDRTGVVIAAYRMVFENWERNRAIAEFLQPEYGYHADLFPELLALLRALDLDFLKSQLAVE